MFTAKQLREIWIKFFREKGFFDVSDRSVVPGASDKSLLFVNSGVAAIKSYFCGDSNLPNRKLVSAQRVIRTGDIDEIGKSFRHHTYFEMLGNFNIGQAERNESIALAWEFLVKVLNFPADRLYVTVFEEDDESFRVWQKYLPVSRIIKGDRSTNFWDMGVGPCGPCTEIYFDRGSKYDPQGIGIDLLIQNQDNERYLEIWNLVFSDFINVDGKITPSPTKNLDTGAGMERLLMILQDKKTSFETTLFSPIVDYLESRFSFQSREYSWASSDYFRTSCILLKDGVSFGNKGRNYILRKLFRKACDFTGARKLDFTFFKNLCVVISNTLDYYDWKSFLPQMSQLMWEEYSLIFVNFEISKNLLHKLFEDYPTEIPTEEIFNLVSRNGISFDYLENEIINHGRKFSKEQYEKLFEKHRIKSLNKNISSAFAKQIPALLEKSIPTEFDYESVRLKSSIVDKYSGEDFHREINDLDEDIYLVLDKTNIFPSSAGQEQDSGLISFSEYSFVVDSSIKAMNGQILHKISGVNDFVRNKIKEFSDCIVSHDPEKRKKISINHTAEHLLYAVLKKIVNEDIKRVSGYKDSEGFSIEVSVFESNLNLVFDLLKINNELNNAIRKCISVETSWGNLEKAKRMGILGKFDEIYEMNEDNLRFVSLGEYGTELCIGTHVKNTKEIEAALITNFKKVGKNSYKFHAITGFEKIEKELQELSMDDYLLNIQNRDQIAKDKKLQKKQVFDVEKNNLLNSLIGGKEKVKILNQKADVNVAMQVFKEIRGYLQNQVVILFFEDNEGHRFFISSQGIGLAPWWDFFRKKGAKCGGNDSFGSGWYEGKDFPFFLNELLEKLNINN